MPQPSGGFAKKRARRPPWPPRYFEQQPVYEYLHDLKNDPDQLKNLTADPKYAKELAAARKRTDELRDSYGGKFDLQRILDFRKNRGRKK